MSNFLISDSPPVPMWGFAPVPPKEVDLDNLVVVPEARKHSTKIHSD